MTAAGIISVVRISDVWRTLGGDELRNSRGRAFWRHGDGYSVALDDARGRWFDHRDGVGGGVLDLVAHVHGGTRQDALRWLANLTGAVLDDEPANPTPPGEFVEASRIRRDAIYFADAATLTAEQVLEALPDDDHERFVHTRLLTALRASPESEYRAWLSHSPRWAAALVNAGRAHQRRIQTRLALYLIEGSSNVE
jgi:hypothetical protein